MRGGAERALESSESEDRHERVEELSDGQWLARVGSHGRGAHVQLDGGRAARREGGHGLVTHALADVADVAHEHNDEGGLREPRPRVEVQAVQLPKLLVAQVQAKEDVVHVPARCMHPRTSRTQRCLRTELAAAA